jgi:glycosyltransferase involved in cell wall biosynthesis
MLGVRDAGHDVVLFGVEGARLFRELHAAGIECVAWKALGQRAVEEIPRRKGRRWLRAVWHRTASQGLKLMAGNLEEVRHLERVFQAHAVDLMQVNVHGYEMAGAACKACGIPSLAMYLTFPPEYADRMRTRLMKASIRSYTWVASQSQACTDAWRRLAGLRTERCSYIWNGADLQRFAAGDRQRSRRKEDPFRIIGVGRLHPMKGHRYLIEAIARSADLRLTLEILGEGEEEDELRRLAADLGSNARVRLCGAVGNPETFLRQADCFALASVNLESGPAVLSEALACGLPLVTSDFGPLPEINLHEVTGLVTPARDSLALGVAFRRLADDPALCERLGQAGRERAQKWFSRERMIAETLRLYERIGSSQPIFRRRKLRRNKRPTEKRWPRQTGQDRMVCPAGSRRTRIGFFSSLEDWGGSTLYLKSLMLGVRDTGYDVVLFGIEGSWIFREMRAVGVECVAWKTLGHETKADITGRATRSTLVHWIQTLWHKLAPEGFKLAMGNLSEVHLLERIFGAYPVDLMHINVNGYEMAGMACDRLGIPSVGMYCVAPHAKWHWLRYFLIQRTIRSYTLLCTKSKAAAEAWCRHTKIPSSRFHYVWNGVDLNRFVNGERKAARVLTEEFRLVSLGRLHPIKGYRYLIEAMRLLKDRRVTLRIGGGGEEEDELRRLVQQYGLQKQIELCGNVEDPVSVMRHADCFVLPSLSESFGSAVAEAMAVGLPVITSDAISLPEINIHGVTGLVAPAANAPALAEAIRTLADHPEECARMGQAGRERALRYFSRERMLAETLRLYETLLAHERG